MSNAVAMTLPPSRLTPASVDDALTDFLESSRRINNSYWAMILGGSGGGCHYSDQDWQMLIKGMNHLAKKHQFKWLILTTRFAIDRTYSLLKQGLSARYVGSIKAYGEGPDDPLPLLAGRAERIYCGAEHLSILFDCVASGKPTVAIFPERSNPNRQARHLVNTLRLERLLSVLKVEELASGRAARPALPLREILARKHEELFAQLCRHCPNLAAMAKRY